MIFVKHGFIIKDRTTDNITKFPDYAGDITKLLTASMTFQLNARYHLFSILTYYCTRADRDPFVQKLSGADRNDKEIEDRFIKQLDKAGKISKVNTTTMACDEYYDHWIYFNG